MTFLKDLLYKLVGTPQERCRHEWEELDREILEDEMRTGFLEAEILDYTELEQRRNENGGWFPNPFREISCLKCGATKVVPFWDAYAIAEAKICPYVEEKEQQLKEKEKRERKKREEEKLVDLYWKFEEQRNKALLKLDEEQFFYFNDRIFEIYVKLGLSAETASDMRISEQVSFRAHRADKEAVRKKQMERWKRRSRKMRTQSRRWKS